MVRARGLPRLQDGLRSYAEDYDPAVHSYHWLVWELPGLPWEAYLSSTQAELERMADHRRRMIDSVARQGGKDGNLSAAILELTR